MKEFSITILAIILLVLLFIYIRNKNSNTNNTAINPPQGISCKSVFFAKLPNDNMIHNFHSQDISFVGQAPNIKYYKNNVTLSESGIDNATIDIEITKTEFDNACKYLYNPPYQWYTNTLMGKSGGITKT